MADRLARPYPTGPAALGLPGGLALGRLVRLPGPWAAVYALAAAALFLPAWLHGDGAWIGNDGDAKLFIWYLTEVPSAIAHGHNPFVTSLLQSPDGINLMWNTSAVAIAAAVAPVTAALGPVAAYNLVVTVGVIGGAVAARAALTRFTASASAAAVGGLVYGLSPFVVAQAMGHLHMAFALYPPLVLLLLTDAVRGTASPRRTGLLLGLATALQLLVGEELLLITAVGAAAVLGVAAFGNPRAAGAVLRPLAVALGIAGGIAALVDAPFLLLQFLGPHRPVGAVLPSGGLVADVEGFIVPTPRQAVSPSFATDHAAVFTLTAEDVDAYIGLPLLLYLAVRARALWSDRRTRLALVAGGVAAVLSMGPTLQFGHMSAGAPLPWRVLGALPLLDDIAPSRFAVVVDLLLALVVAVEVERAIEAFRRRRAEGGGWSARVPIQAAVLGACLVPLVPSVPYPTTADTTPAFFTDAASRILDGSVVLVTPWADSNGSESMLWQARAGMRWSMPSGEALGNGDGLDGEATALRSTLDAIDRHGAPVPELTPALRAALLGDLAWMNVRTVVVGPSGHPAAVRALFHELLAGTPEDVEGVTVWWTVAAAGTS
ncbi:MAG TPA: hypothetical protein VFO60_02315 [Candidatus Dormibacteraeota bacterium]|nr:hypothetical protein [Candidatus Dormibacteraeota bacterium]